MRSRFLMPRLVLLLGYSFLYIPVLILVFFSFNESRLASVWTGFSLRWYQALFQNESVIQAAGVSFRIATVAATVSTVLGTVTALSLVRFRGLRVRGVLNGLVAGPLVMPDIIMGIALLLLFTGMEAAWGWPVGRGVLTVATGHITLGTAYVTVVMRSRLGEMDHTLEEAALDLGAPPWKVFWLVTFPLILPSLAASWMLSFALSLDDIVLASFLSGPGSTTLPMVILSHVRLGISPQINALTTLIVAFLSLGVLGAAVVMIRRGRVVRVET